jgi:hypothetical protein
MVIRLFEELNLLFRNGLTVSIQLRRLFLSFRFTLSLSFALSFDFF